MSLNFLFACNGVAPVRKADVPLAEGFHECLPVVNFLEVVLSRLESLLVHLVMDHVQKLLHLAVEVLPLGMELLSAMPDANLDFPFLEIFWTEFESHWSALQLPLVVLEAWILIGVVAEHSEALFLKLTCDLVSLVPNFFNVVACLEDWNYHDLCLRDFWWQYQALVI